MGQPTTKIKNRLSNGSHSDSFWSCLKDVAEFDRQLKNAKDLADCLTTQVAWKDRLNDIQKIEPDIHKLAIASARKRMNEIRQAMGFPTDIKRQQ